MTDQKEVSGRVVEDVLFEPISKVEDMKEYEILEVYPEQNSIKVKDKNTEKVLIIGPKRADIESLFE